MYHNISIDIAKFDGDAIVNSLGQGKGTLIPGQIFGSIINASKDKEGLWADADSWASREYGDVFVTGSYGLPCKKIIHVITPVKHMDHGNSLIKKAYRDILQKAVDEGVTSISVPVIGTGANGYKPDTVTEIAQKACYQFAKQHPEIEVFLNLYSLENGYDEDKVAYQRYQRERQAQRALELQASGSPRTRPGNEYGFRVAATSGARIKKETADPLSKPIDPSLPLLREFGMAEGDSVATIVRKYAVYRAAKKGKTSENAKARAIEEAWTSINLLVDRYKTDPDEVEPTADEIHERLKDDRPLPAEWMGMKDNHFAQYDWKIGRHGKSYYWECPTRAEVLLTCVGLGLGTAVGIELFYYCGFSLSPYEKSDRAFRECVRLLGNGTTKCFAEIVATFKRVTKGVSLYNFSEHRRKVYVSGPEDW